MSHKIESTISNLVKNQFPEFYQSEGPIFVAFVTKYFEWLETSSPSANQTYSEAKQNCRINVQAGNTTIYSPNTTTTFNDCFSNGDAIAVYTQADGSDYTTFTVNTVVNNSLLILNESPDFTLANTRFSKLKSQKNPVKFLRDFYKDIDIDETSDEFLIYFKEKYLKDIQFTTEVDQRRIIKHALDIYRSKGTERSVELLFRIAFGTTPRMYYPGDDIFRLSDGHWYKPQYLEVSLRESNVKMINKQIFGYKSGATAFVESVIRKTVKGRLIDVIYISAINGEFETGELINTEDNILSNNERPTIIGSLSNLVIIPGEAGSNFTIGDLLDFESTSGQGGIARVSGVELATGFVDLSLDDGGYGYSSDAEVLISNSVVRIDQMVVPHDTTINDYFLLFEKLIQPSGIITYENSTGTFTNGDFIYMYHANNDVKAYGEALNVSGTTEGTITVSWLSGAYETGTIYNAANVLNADILTFSDTTSYGNVMAWSNQTSIYLDSKIGDFQEGEWVYQIDGSVITTGGTVNRFDLEFGDQGTLLLNSIDGVYKSNTLLRGAISNATANVIHQKFEVGLIDLWNGDFGTLTNNYVYSEQSGITGTIIFVSAGAGLGFQVSDSLLYEESVDVNNDWIIDYYNYPLTHPKLTGTLDITSGDPAITGSGTAFLSEVGFLVTGNAAVNTTSNSVFGTGTDFENELIAGDILKINAEYVKVREVVNSAFLVVNSAFSAALDELPITMHRWLTIKGSGSVETHRVNNVTDDTNLTLETNPGFTDASSNGYYSWGFPGNTSANLTYGLIENVLSNTSITIGRIGALEFINTGSNYNTDPFIRVYENLSYARKEFGIDELSTTGATFSFQRGEDVLQTATGARGIVISSNSSFLLVSRLRLEDSKNFIETSNSTTYITGQQSGAQANITAVTANVDSKFIGFNAEIQSPASFANGAITELEIVDSGFGFRKGEEINLISNNRIAVATAELGRYGTGSGFYRQKGGFLSDQKKLFDGFYYQDYSYEIRSPIQLSKYEDMLKQLLHVAGTQYFGGFVFDTNLESKVSVAEFLVSVMQFLADASGISSITEVGNPNVGRNYVFGDIANDLEALPEMALPIPNMKWVFENVGEATATTEVDNPNIGQEHALLKTNIESTVQIGAPVYGVVLPIPSDIASAVEIVIPEFSQLHILGDISLESAVELVPPLLTNIPINVLDPIGLESRGQLGEETFPDEDDVPLYVGPEVDDYRDGYDGTLQPQSISTYISTTTDVELEQFQIILPADLESIPELGTPVPGVVIAGTSISSVPQLDGPTVGQSHGITAVGITINTEVGDPQGGYIFTASDIESSTPITEPTFTGISVLGAADDIESASEVETPTIAQVHDIIASDISSQPELGSTRIQPDDSLILEDGGDNYYLQEEGGSFLLESVE